LDYQRRMRRTFGICCLPLCKMWKKYETMELTKKSQILNCWAIYSVKWSIFVIYSFNMVCTLRNQNISVVSVFPRKIY
jgi:hypothetical protein